MSVHVGYCDGCGADGVALDIDEDADGDSEGFTDCSTYTCTKCQSTDAHRDCKCDPWVDDERCRYWAKSIRVGRLLKAAV